MCDRVNFFLLLFYISMGNPEARSIVIWDWRICAAELRNPKWRVHVSTYVVYSVFGLFARPPLTRSQMFPAMMAVTVPAIIAITASFNSPRRLIDCCQYSTYVGISI